MSDTWINRLVVSGVANEVEAFAAAAGPRAHRSARRAGLSFRALQQSLGPGSPDDDADGPYEVIAERPERLRRGMARRVYRFEQAGYEPDDLLVAASRAFPRVCLVLGWVAPSVDEQASKLIYRGRARRHDVPARRKREIYGALPDDDSDETTWAYIEADWQALDEVVTYWDREVARILARLATPPQRR